MCSPAALDATVAMLRRKDAMGYTTVVAAPAGASLGERYAAVATACALGERARDTGGHALVVIDDLSCMVRNAPAQCTVNAVMANRAGGFCTTRDLAYACKTKTHAWSHRNLCLLRVWSACCAVHAGAQCAGVRCWGAMLEPRASCAGVSGR